MITKDQYQILEYMYGEYDTYYPYSYWVEYDRDLKTVKRIIKELKDMGVVEYRRGLMNEEGEVAGSGHGIPYGKHDEVVKLIEEYKNTVTSL